MPTSQPTSAFGSESAIAPPAFATHSAPRRLRSNAVWMLVGNLANAGARFAIVWIIVKIGTQEMVGQFGWALAFCIPAITICRFGARIQIATDTRSESSLSDYLGFTILGAVAGMLLIVGLILVDGETPYVTGVVLLIGLWNTIESISDFYAGIFQRLDKMKYIAAAYILQAILTCVFLTIALWLTNDLMLAATSLVMAAAIRLVAFEIPIARRLARSPIKITGQLAGHGIDSAVSLPRFDWFALSRMTLQGVPLAIVTFLLVYCTNVPRYVLRDTLGDAELGAFVALFSLAFAPTLVTNSVSQSLWSRLAILYANNDRAGFLFLLWRTSFLAIAIGGLGITIAMLVGKPLLSVVLTPEYAVYQDVFVVLMLAGAIEGLAPVFGAAVTSMRRFSVQVPVQIAKLAVVYFGCTWMAVSHGLIGVAWVMVGAGALANACNVALCFWGLRVRAENKQTPTLSRES